MAANLPVQEYNLFVIALSEVRLFHDVWNKIMRIQIISIINYAIKIFGI